MSDPDPTGAAATPPPPGWQPPPTPPPPGGQSAWAQPPPTQPYPGQAYPGQAYPGQAYPGQAYPGQAYPGQAYPGQAYPGQAHPGQAHPGQPYPGQTYPGQPYPPQPYPPHQGWVGAAHKPGAMPLRPLGLGDIYDAAFRIIRFNPKATVGSAVLVASVAMAIPVLITAILTATVDSSFDVDDSSGSGFDQSTVVGLVGSLGSLGLGVVLAGFGTILVTGMITHVAAAAAIGRRLTLGEAWAATRGKRWRLVGLALLLALALVLVFAAYAAAWVLVVLVARDSVVAIVVWGLVSVPAFLVFLVWFWVRVYYLPVPALMLEPVGVLGALRRAFVLTRRQFWRTLGIALLTTIVVGIAGQVIGLPVGLIGQVASVAVGDRYTLLVLVVTQALTQVATAAFATPFSGAVTSLQYLDQRMRKEAYDVELMQQAGITA